MSPQPTFDHDQPEISRRTLLGGIGFGLAIAAVGSVVGATGAQAVTSAKKLLKVPGFDKFSSAVKVMKSGNYYLVECDAMQPVPNVMVGITGWQQQVPVPQKYSGTNAWKIPVKPKLASTPFPASSWLDAAIALAVNGVPIFNAASNTGINAAADGQLDKWGGHCGRADDYHYHVAPLHLVSVVGQSNPIAYALDGFPIYGLTEPDGAAVVGLDEYNGHSLAKYGYHYHGTTTSPSTPVGLRGVATIVKDHGFDRVSPQPTTPAFRPPGEPLRGAVITGFSQTGKNAYSLVYTLNGARQSVDYTATLDTVSMTFTSASGAKTSETYQRNQPPPPA